MMVLKVIKIGDDYGVVLPPEMLEDLGLQVGDGILACKVDEHIELSKCDSDLERVLVSNQDYMERHQNALKELAG